MTTDTPGTVSEVSATFVATITVRRSGAGDSAASCAAPSSEPWSGTRSHPASRAAGTAVRDRGRDLPRARKETENVAAGVRPHPRDRLCDGFTGRVLDGEGMQRAGHLDDRAAVQEGRNRRRVERGRHHQDPQIRSRGPCLFHERETDIRVHAAFVKFIHDDRGDIAQQRIVLQVCGEDAFGDHEEARVSSEVALEPDVPAHLAADRPAPFIRDPSRHRASGHATRLQQQHTAVAGERRRHARRLAGAGRGDEHGGPVAFQGDADFVDERINRQDWGHD